MDNWWWNKQWAVRENGLLGPILDRGDTLSLEPNTTNGNPSFFWIRYTGNHACWEKRYVYAVGVNPPSISLSHSWNDAVPPEKQAKGVAAEYQTVGRQVRSVADDPYTAKLEGHIRQNGKWEIIRLFCFPAAQPNGRDWIVIDALQTDAVRFEEDGTASDES
jgi:hypothetical protein